MAEYISLTQPSLKSRALDRVYSLVAVAIALLYVATSFLAFREKSIVDWKGIVGSFLASLFLGQSIKNLLRAQGVHNGRAVDVVKQIEEKHRSISSRVVRYVNAVDQWCVSKNRENLIQQRARILAASGMQYDDYFDEDGRPRDVTFGFVSVRLRDRIAFWRRDGAVERAKMVNRVETKKMKAFNRACRLRLGELSAAALIGTTRCTDAYELGRDVETYLGSKASGGILSTIGIAAATAYFGVDFILNPELGKVMLIIGQDVTYLAMGLVAMRQAYNFTTGEYRQRVQKQCDLMEEFFEDQKASEGAA